MQTFVSIFSFDNPKQSGKDYAVKGARGSAEKLLHTDKIKKDRPAQAGWFISFQRQFFPLTATAFSDTIRKSKDFPATAHILGRLWVRLSFF